jgi:hypothetical protein
MYRRGDQAYVMMPRAKMVVWEVLDASVLVCTPGAYDAALKSGQKPRTVEYREWGLRPA